MFGICEKHKWSNSLCEECNTHTLIISLYVDDLLIAGDEEQLVEEFKNNMKSMFEMNELGKQSYFLGMEIRIFLVSNKVWY